jgi:sugar lactone lactonase YvrE
MTNPSATNPLRRLLLVGAAAITVTAAAYGTHAIAVGSNPKVGQMEVVTEFRDFAPSNATVSADGRIFVTNHGQRRGPIMVGEVGSDGKVMPFPNASWNGAPASGPDVFNTPNGILIDSRDRLWIIDHGNWLPQPQAPRLLAFDLKTRELVFRHTFDAAVAPARGLAQDLAVDAERGFVYVADSAGNSPGLIVVDIAKNSARAFKGHASLAAENVDIVMDGQVLQFRRPDGTMAPARLAINPISLSANGETLFYGAMNGQTLYQLPTAVLRDGKPDAEVAASIKVAGRKPGSNGMTTDAEGNHYITNLGDNAIDVLAASGGSITRLVQDPRLSFPDSVRFGKDGWLYVLSTQLHKAPIFAGKPESATPPYLLTRVYTGKQGQIGR